MLTALIPDEVVISVNDTSNNGNDGDDDDDDDSPAFGAALLAAALVMVPAIGRKRITGDENGPR